MKAHFLHLSTAILWFSCCTKSNERKQRRHVVTHKITNGEEKTTCASSMSTQLTYEVLCAMEFGCAMPCSKWRALSTGLSVRENQVPVIYSSTAFRVLHNKHFSCSEHIQETEQILYNFFSVPSRKQHPRILLCLYILLRQQRRYDSRACHTYVTTNGRFATTFRRPATKRNIVEPV